MDNGKYSEYFEIDEKYFPCIDDSAIKAGAPWENTYPHETFIKLLTDVERMLGGSTKRSIWIHGAYGTGKSQCAHALKKLLEVPEAEFRAYWGKYEPLQKKTDLLEKLLGHKSRKIVTAYRYSSGDITSPRQLFMVVQERIKKALIEQQIPYTGENTLKESVIAWIEAPGNKPQIDYYLQTPEWMSVFSQSTADEVLNALRKGGEIKSLMDNLSRLADKVGITALDIDADRLKAWIVDVIKQNDIKIVLVWDEFSSYFKQNKNSLDEFQKIIALCQQVPFYFIIVTHQTGSILDSDDAAWSVVQQRFNFTQITLPDNIAFDLIGHAFNVKPAAKIKWEGLADDLNSRFISSRPAVMKAAKIEDAKVMRDIMPLHPMAALILLNIASTFQANQRSMFDFIKTSNTDDVKAFQWFIENTGPHDNHPLLTVDMLWNFFYEKGRDNLPVDIQIILDTFPQQQNLREDEKAVLKAILIMQAIDQRLGGAIDLFKATEQNLSYVFEGIYSGLEGSCKNLAKGLVKNGILVSSPIGGGRHVFAAAVLAGDQGKIDSYKKNIHQNSTTSKLVSEGGLSNVLSLSPALRLRFESELNTGKITPVTPADFTREINKLRDKTTGWKFHAVIAFAKDDTEAAIFRKMVKAAVADKQYENIVFIDTLSTPLGSEAFEQYMDYSAMAMYYSRNRNAASRENDDKAKHVLDQDWRNRIYSGQFFVYTYTNQEGEKLGNGQAVSSILQRIVTSRFPFVFDFSKNLTESQLKLTPATRKSAEGGILQSTSGVMVGIEKNILFAVWKTEKYWENPTKANFPISKIKTEIDKLIDDAFNRDGVGQISIGDIYDFLQEKYGFAPCNLSALLAGFLLKEYAGEPFRYSDSSGSHEAMTPDKLAEMLGNYIGKTPKATYIVKMTAEERSFYELTERVWGIEPNSCSSPTQAAMAVNAKMRGLGLPVWCLSEVDDDGVYDVVQKYIELVQKEKGNEAHIKAFEIGKIATIKTTLSERLTALLTKEKCQLGMRKFLASFEEGKILSLASEIGADGNVLTDIRDLFKEVKYSCLWDRQTGEDVIRKLLIDYGIVKISNILLNVTSHSRLEAFKAWRERLKFIGISCDSLRAKLPPLAKFFDTLLKIYQQLDVLPEQLKDFLSELTAHSMEIQVMLNNDKCIFLKIYAPYLEGLTDFDIGEVKNMLPMGMFELSKTDSNAKVKKVAEEFLQKQLKTQLLKVWKDKTGTKTPYEWSNRYRTPILCCVSEDEYEMAKKTFETLNRSGGPDAEIKSALAFLESTRLFEVLSDECKRNTAFKRDILGGYSCLLPDIERVRDVLDLLSIDTYEWRESPSVKTKIEKLAKAEYNAGGSDKVILKIDKMDDSQLKQYLKRLISENMTVGIEIIMNGSE